MPGCGRSWRGWAPRWAYAYPAASEQYGETYPGQSRPFQSRAHWRWEGSGWGQAFGPRGRFFEGGEVRLALLSLLHEGPKNGYQLMKEMKERSGGLYSASAGTVYPTLQMLEDEGLIEPVENQTKRIYRLTDAGRTELERDPEAVRRIWQRAEHWEDWSQYRGPEMFALLTPISVLAKSVLKSAKWAYADPDRDAKVRELFRKVTKEFEDLTKS